METGAVKSSQATASFALRPPRWVSALARLWTFLFFAICVAIPLAALGWRAAGAIAQLGDPSILATARATAVQAWLSVSVSALIGIPAGLWLEARTRASERMSGWVSALLVLPAGVPTVVAATSWVAWLGRSGYLSWMDLAYRLEAVIVAHVFYNAPWIALLVFQARRQMPEAPLEAARQLGAGRWAAFQHVTWPRIRPAALSACAQALAFCSMSFALVLILGGGPPVETLETALYSRVRFGQLDLAGATACAFWEVVMTLIPWAAVVWFSRTARMEGVVTRPDPRTRSRPSAGVFSAANWALALAAVGASIPVLPYLVVFAPGSIRAWGSASFWGEILGPLRLSLALATGVGGFTLVTSSVAVLALSGLGGSGRGRAFSRASSIALAFPGSVSALVLGLGGWFAYSRWVDPFAGSWVAIWLLQATLFFPVAYRILWPIAQAGNRARLEGAVLLGASPARAFWLIDAARWRTPMIAVFALVTSAALGEVAAVSLFYSEDLIPLPLLVSRWMGQYRFEEARAVASLLFLLSAGITLVCAKEQSHA
jgi:thiamine transport system permease protein